MAQETNQTQGPLRCSNGCGFYGNPRNNGMCSVCYKDSLQRQNNSGRSSDPVSSSLSSKGESMNVQPSSQHEQNSQCFSTSSAHNGSSSAASSDVPRTGPWPEDEPSRGKRKLQESSAPVEALCDEPEEPKPKRNRCFTCHKRVGLTGFGCRCGLLFCSVHRYSDVHDCSFDYKADAAEKIRKENPLIVGEKVVKI